jgi:hypothetical protein
MSDVAPTTVNAARTQADVIALAQSLARPVVRNMLPLAQAFATIAAVVGRGCRLGLLQVEDPQGLIETAIHIMGLHIEQQETNRDNVVSDINRRLWPLIDQRVPANRLRAEAHDLNGEAALLLTEAEVEQAIVDLLYRARGQARGKAPRMPRRYHG